MKPHLYRQPRTGGFGMQTLLPMADGGLSPVGSIEPGMMLEGQRTVTETYRFWMREAVLFNGSVYSPANVIKWRGSFVRLAAILNCDPDHKHLGPTQMICLSTSDNRIETLIGLMVDFGISEERRQLVKAKVMARRVGQVDV